ncbi:ufm1-specific protease 2 [Onthophagus taurus]|uniref:ufm1-specific protease 2 n=1 Tax=Onthophagus taurus TaxID=166361 RepID=UPI000C20E299|nr:ufm1-specific protease 2-like [Onthophagus taurus]
MKPLIKLSEAVVARLTAVKEPCLGNLYGVFYNKTQCITSLFVNNNDQTSGTAPYFPTEIELCGVFEVNTSLGGFDHKKLENTLTNIQVTDNPLYIKIIIDQNNKIESFFIVNDQLEAAKVEILKDYELYSDFMHIRLRAQLPLVCNPDEDSIKEGLVELKRNIDNGMVAFYFSKPNVFILGNDAENGVTGSFTECNVEELYLTSLDESKGKSKNLNDVLKLDVIEATMFNKVTSNLNGEQRRVHAPIVQVDKKKFELLNMVLNLDALSMVHKKLPVKNLYEILVASCFRNLFLLQRTILKYFQQSGGDFSKISYPEIYHFYPNLCGHFVTRVFGKGETDESLEQERKIIQDKLLLPLTMPFFRRGNRYIFNSDQEDDSPLISPHLSVKNTNNGGEIAVVRGNYEYYHYSQQKMDDNGWGCAYRSLQTLASWFNHQGYSTKLVPTHRDIQKCLVDIGDKPPNFIGSKQWIGSMEVGFVLETLLGITSKVLQCSSGAEMGSIGLELLTHFKTNGSPVMIGGGVLAHTILGVDCNHDNGNVKFLILDPHYVGGEDLDKIINKGYCGWKGVEFWDKKAFYNMCMPIVPKCL